MLPENLRGFPLPFSGSASNSKTCFLKLGLHRPIQKAY